MKRVLTFILSIVMAFAIIPFSAFASDDGKEDWEIYDNYLYYNNDGTKTTGYTIDKVNFQLTSEFLDEHFNDVLDASYFPGIADSIEKLEYIDFYEYNIVFRETDPEFSQKRPVYTEEEIDEYIGFLKYIRGLDFVLDIVPEKITIEPFDPVEDWEKYENYLYYDNDGTKGSGYRIEDVYVVISTKYLSENEVSVSTFPEIKDRIVRIMPPSQYSSSQNLFRIDFKVYDPYVAHDPPEYTEEEIDEYIAIVKYLNSLDIVISAKPETYFIAYIDDPTQITASETESNADAETTAEPETTEETASETAKAETTDTSVPETTAADGNVKKSAQTGDPLIMYIVLASVALLSGCVISAYMIIKARKHNR